MSTSQTEQTAGASGVGQSSEPAAVRQVREAAEALLAEGKQQEAFELLLAALAALARKDRDLELLVAKLRKEAVGKRSERVDTGQLSLMFEQLLEASSGEIDAEAEAREEEELDREIKQAEEERAKTQPRERRRRRGGVKPRVAELQVHQHEVPPDQRTCGECGEEKQRIGEDVSYRLEYVPGHFIQHEHHLEKLACPRCKDGVTTAVGVPQVIERSQAEPSLLAHLVVSKYEDHCPLHRLSRIYERSGVEIAVSTLADWAAAVADRLQPLVAELEGRVADSFLVRTDATGIKVLDRAASENVQRGTFWAYVLDDADVLFRYTPTGQGETGPWEFLGGCTGYVQADAANVFDRVFNGRVAEAIEVGCWAHARRKLVELQDSDFRVAYPLKLIARLYRIEHLADARGLAPPERKLMREERSQPVFERLKGWAAIVLAAEPPGSTLAQAVRYMRNHWGALTRFVQDGRLDLDNNLCERQLRAIALGRRNYLFCGSDQAARRAATLYSLLRTCALRGVSPLPYLTDVLTKLAAGWPKERLVELLPDRWQPEPATQAAQA